jgi:hypothetical protein
MATALIAQPPEIAPDTASAADPPSRLADAMPRPVASLGEGVGRVDWRGAG